MAQTYNIGNILGPQGKSAYDVWLSQGNAGTEQDFLSSLVGPVGATGPAADITGQSLYDHAVATGFTGTYDDWLREYLGRRTDLPWVSGHFQDISLANATSAELTPIFEAGDAQLISGNDFIASSAGVWALNVFGGTLATSPNGAGYLYIITKPVIIAVASVINGAFLTQVLPSICGIKRLESGEAICHTMSSRPAQSGFTNNGAAPRYFIFAQLTKEAP